MELGALILKNAMKRTKRIAKKLAGKEDISYSQILRLVLKTGGIN